ncbi:MAG TPA: hypothetical protein VEB59_12035 [Gemmatimonadales bacterium]|nr:hypothetical protein [Gemmatimonadales bacterium]
MLALLAVVASAQLGRSIQPDSQRGQEESSFVATDSPAPPAPDRRAAPSTASVGGSAAGAAPELRVARTWTHVRKSRSKSAVLEAVLLPGDTVVADSLGKGWYRVALEGEVLGYAHQSTLAAAGDIQTH